MTRFLVAWNLWIYALVFVLEMGLLVTNNLASAMGQSDARLANSQPAIATASIVVTPAAECLTEHIVRTNRENVIQSNCVILKTVVGAVFEVRPKRDVTACLRARLCRISALPSRDRKGGVTNYNCFPHTHLTSGELANSRRCNCRSQGDCRILCQGGAARV
jgi:hypothetical protein